MRRLTDDDFSMAGVPAIYVGYSLQYDSWNRVYTDTYSGMQTPSKDGGSADAPVPTTPLYEHWYFNGTASRDSTFESKLSNRLFVQLPAPGTGMPSWERWMRGSDWMRTVITSSVSRIT